MKILYKYQKFQADAAKAVVDVFAGQPYLTPTYMMVLSSKVLLMMLILPDGVTRELFRN